MTNITYKNKFFIAVLAIFAALPPFAINTYSPAIPQISKYFSIPEAAVIVTVTTYFIGFAIGMLVWGAFSDIYGRKRILIIGMVLYIMSTVACSITESFSTLMFMRFIQGFSDSTGAIVAMAMTRDCYTGKKLMAMMASILIIMMAAPITAPIIGSILIISTQKWQSIFYFLSLYGILLLIIACFLQETLAPNGRQKHIWDSLVQFKDHLTNRKFIVMSLSAGLCFAGFFSFVGSSSIIFLTIFSAGYTLYCVLFAVTFTGIIIANYMIKKMSVNISSNRLCLVGFVACLFGVVICVISTSFLNNMYLFTLGITIVTFGFGLNSTVIISEALNSVSKGFGAANSISNFIKFTLGGLSNFYMSYFTGSSLMSHLYWQDLFIALLSAILFLWVCRKN
jgi:MFS transporter, DHA1 family, multidrug resistance protein